MFNIRLQLEIEKNYGSLDKIPVNLLPLFKSISDSYDREELERTMFKRSIALSSGELIELNNKLINETTELKKTHTELNTLFENIDEVFFSVDMISGYKLLQMSQGCLKMYGYTIEDFFKTHNLWFDVILDEDKSIIENNYPHLNAGKKIKQEYRIYHKDKSTRFIETKITPTLDGNGKLIRIDGLSTDITERKNAEKKAYQSEKRFRKLIENSHDGIALLGPEGKLIYITPSILRILGYKPEELLNSDPVDFTHPDDKENIISVIERLIPRYGETEYATYRMKNKNGSWRWLNSNITNMLHESSIRAIVFNYKDITESINAELQLESDRTNSEALINSTTDLMWSVDTKNLLIKANNAFISLMQAISGVVFKPGDSMENIPGMPIEQIKKWEPYYYKAFSGENLIFEEHNNFNGIELWNEISMQPIFENGQVTGVSCFSRNISESKRSLQIIKQNEEMMVEAQGIAHFGSWELSLIETENNSLNTLRWSDEVFRIFGYEPGQYDSTLMNFFNAVHPDDRIFVTKALEKALKENSRYHIEHRVVRPNGEIRWVRENGKIIVEEKTFLPQKMIGTVQDITNRKKAQLAQENAEANLRNILENTDTAYVLLDTDLTILSFNRLAKELSQQQTSKTIREGLNYIEIMPENRKVEVKIKTDALLIQQKKISYETVFHNKKGEELWLFVSMNPIFTEDGQLLGLSIAARNITERKLLELEKTKITNDITQRNKDLEQFTYIVSHNLRSPVASILGLSILLDTPGIDEKTRNECFKGFVSSVKNLDSTIIDLNYILQARKEISEKKELVGFSDIVESIKESIGTLIAKEDVKINIDFSHIDEMYTLKSYLYSIFYNLISNSIKYRKQNEAPVIDITSKRIDKKIVIEFSDNCLGIDMKEHGNNVFGLYKRFHLNVEGKGMGLYMVKTQVETLGGKVGLTSEVNHGTKFTLEFDV